MSNKQTELQVVLGPNILAIFYMCILISKLAGSMSASIVLFSITITILDFSIGVKQ